MRILYIGSAGALSLVPLRHLLDSRHTVAAAAVDARLSAVQGSLIVTHNETVEMLARMRGIPVIDLQQPLAESVGQLTDAAPDVILTACYNRPLATEITTVPRYGAFNMHPSLLPLYRGPMPVFWQMHDGLETLGISIHRMIEELDAGNIVARQPVPIPDGTGYDGINSLLALAGAQLFSALLEDIENGRVQETAQDESKATYQGFPSEAAFFVSTQWSARRLYRFVRGTSGLGRPYRLRDGNHTIWITDAIQWSRTRGECNIDNGIIEIACRDGFVAVQAARL